MPLATLALLYVYGFLAFCFSAIAGITGTSGAWMAWVPPFQPFLLTKLAARPVTWVVALLVPGLNLVVAAILLGDVAAARRLPRVLGVLTVGVPVVVTALAWSQGGAPVVTGLGSGTLALCAYAGLTAFAR